MEFSVPRHGAGHRQRLVRRTGRDAVPAVLEKFLYADAGGISAVACGVLRRAGAAAGFVLRACGRQPSDASARPAVSRNAAASRCGFLAGCHIVQTPLQRMTGTCLFFLYSSGCTTLVPGMRKADAECLSAKLTHGGKLL